MFPRWGMHINRVEYYYYCYYYYYHYYYYYYYYYYLSLILISEPTRPYSTSYAVFCLQKKT